MNLTNEHVKRLDNKEVMKYQKRYETYVCAKTTENLIDAGLSVVRDKST